MRGVAWGVWECHRAPGHRHLEPEEAERSRGPAAKWRHALLPSKPDDTASTVGRAGAIVLALTADDASDEQRQRARAADLRQCAARSFAKLTEFKHKIKFLSKVEVAGE